MSFLSYVIAQYGLAVLVVAGIVDLAVVAVAAIVYVKTHWPKRDHHLDILNHLLPRIRPPRGMTERELRVILALLTGGVYILIALVVTQLAALGASLLLAPSTAVPLVSAVTLTSFVVLCLECFAYLRIRPFLKFVGREADERAAEARFP